MIDAEKLCKRYNRAVLERDKFKNLYKPVYDFILPDRYTQVEDNQEAGDRKRLDLYTSLAEQCADRFVQRVQSLLTPVNVDWIGFEAGYTFTANENNNSNKVNQELEKIAKICNVFKDVSNFDSEATSFYYDLIPGTAYMSVFEGTPEIPLVFKTIPFKEMVIENGADGYPDHYYRKFKMKNELVKQQWTDAKFEFEEGKEQDEAELLESTYKDGTRWTYCVITMQDKKVIVEKSFRTSPFICLRWTVNSGEQYGRGCGLKCISDIKTHNKIKEYSLKALGFTIPVFTASMDGNYDVDSFVFAPGAINPVPSNMTNNPTIQQLAVAQQPDLEQYKVTELEMDIKKAMFDTTIPNDPTKMTATEINQRAGELAEQLNNSFGRLINEYLYPLVRRIVDVLQNFGYIDEQFDINAMNGWGYKIKINTALARQQKTQDLNNIMQFLQFCIGIDPTMSLVSKIVDTNKLFIEFARLSGVSPAMIRSEDEVKSLQQQEQIALQQQQQQAMSDQVAMSNAIEKGKADAKGNM